MFQYNFIAALRKTVFIIKGGLSQKLEKYRDFSDLFYLSDRYFKGGSLLVLWRTGISNLEGIRFHLIEYPKINMMPVLLFSLDLIRLPFETCKVLLFLAGR